MNRIRAATQRMAQLIDDLLNLARVTRGEMRTEAVDLSALANVSPGASSRTREPERQRRMRRREDVMGHGDSRLLRVVLENLLGNAWKFTMKKPQSQRLSSAWRIKTDTPVYFVRDNGAGFDMAYVDKLFGTFQRLHAVTEFPAPAIGLASVQRIIHRHGGTDLGGRGGWARARRFRLRSQNMKEGIRMHESKSSCWSKTIPTTKR